MSTAIICTVVAVVLLLAQQAQINRLKSEVEGNGEWVGALSKRLQAVEDATIYAPALGAGAPAPKPKKKGGAK